MDLTRREFLKMLVAGGAAAAFDVSLAQETGEGVGVTRWRRVFARAAKSYAHYSLCNLCALHCMARVIRDERDNVYLAGGHPQHPYCGYQKVGPPDVAAFYLSLCHRPLTALEAEKSGLLPRAPVKIEGGREEALEMGDAVSRAAALIGSGGRMAAIGGSGLSNEGCYLARRLLFGLGVAYVDTISRRIMGPTTSAFLATLGRPGATNPITDLINTSSILVIGADPATEMPVLTRWLFEAQSGSDARFVVVDSRQTGTAARAEAFIQVRPGTESALVLGLISEALRRNTFVPSYLNKNTDISFLIHDAFRTVADADGVFSGFKDGRYDRTSWRYIYDLAGRVIRDEKLKHPRVLLSVLRKHFSIYEWSSVCRVCGISRAQFEDVFDAFVDRCASSSQSGVVLFGSGVTARSNGTQTVRALLLLQILLGNLGLPGGGLLPVVPHGNAQGACDLGFLAGYLPGYLPAPLPAETKSAYIERCSSIPCYSRQRLERFLEAFLNDLFGKSDEEAFGLLPRASVEETTVYGIVQSAAAGEFDGIILLGEDPSEAVGGLWLEALQRLKWVVVFDWRKPWWASHSKALIIHIPARPFWETVGTFTNISRTIQWTSAPEGWATQRPTDVQFIRSLVSALGERGNLSRIRWDRLETPADVMHTLSGLRGKTPVPHTRAVTKDTRAYCWLYAGFEAGVANPNYQDTSGMALYPQLGWAWPDNVRVAFNRAGTDTKGKPYLIITRGEEPRVLVERKGDRWVGQDVVDGLEPPDKGGFATESGLARIFTPELASGPLPTYYEEPLLPFENIFAPAVRTVPVMVRRPETEGVGKAGVVATLFLPCGRLPFLGLRTEISRRVSGGEFVEIDEETAAELGIKDGEKVFLKGPVGGVEVRVVLTRRLRRWVSGGIAVGSVAIPVDIVAKLWPLAQETDGMAAAEVGSLTLERR